MIPSERLSEIEKLIVESDKRWLGDGFVGQLTAALRELVLEVRTNGRPHFNKTMTDIALLEAKEGSGRVMHGALKAAFIANANARDAEDARYRVPLTTLCSSCREPQFSTPSGTTCKNGHGGADGIDP